MQQLQKRRGRPSKTQLPIESSFNTDSIKLIRGNELKFNDALFIPMKTKSEIDTILSTGSSSIQICVFK